MSRNVTLICELNMREAELPLILPVTFTLNLVALAVLYRMKNTSESLDRLLVSSLVINDLLSTVLFIISFLLEWSFCGVLLEKKAMCSILGWVSSSMVMWSAGVITVMATCRYLALVKPLYYRSNVTSGRVKAGLIGTLIWMVVHLSFPFFGIVAPFRFYENNKICAYEFSVGVGGMFHRVVLGMIGVEGMLTVILILFFNVSIIYQLRKRSKVHVESNSDNSTQRHGRHRRTAFVHVTLIVSFFYCVCYCPFLLRLIYDVVINAPDQDGLHHSVSMSLLFLSPLLNPILYGVFNKRFRQCLLDMFKSCFRSCRCLSRVHQEQEVVSVKPASKHVTSTSS